MPHEKTIKQLSPLERFSDRCTKWVGSSTSLVVHTIIFISAFLLGLSGIAWATILLVLTTVVSLEAIYLSIFIQISVNRNTRSLEVVEENIDEIQEDVDEIQEDVDEIQEDVDEIQEDIDEIQEDVDEITTEDSADAIAEDAQEMIHNIEKTLAKLLEDVNALRNNSQK